MNTTLMTFEAPGAQTRRIERPTSDARASHTERGEQDAPRAFDSVLEETTRERTEQSAEHKEATPAAPQDQVAEKSERVEAAEDADSEMPEGRAASPGKSDRSEASAVAVRMRASLEAQVDERLAKKTLALVTPQASARHTKTARAVPGAKTLASTLDGLTTKLSGGTRARAPGARGRSVDIASANVRLSALAAKPEAEADVSAPQRAMGDAGDEEGLEGSAVDAIAQGADEQAVKAESMRLEQGEERRDGPGRSTPSSAAAAMQGAGEERGARDRKIIERLAERTGPMASDAGAPEGFAMAQTATRADLADRVQSMIRAQRASATQRTISARMGATDKGGWLEVDLPGAEADASLKVRIVEQRAEIVVGVRGQQASPEVMRAVEEIRRILTDLGLELESVDVQTQTSGGQDEHGARHARDSDTDELGGPPGRGGEGRASEDEQEERDRAVSPNRPGGLEIEGIVHVVA